MKGFSIYFLLRIFWEWFSLKLLFHLFYRRTVLQQKYAKNDSKRFTLEFTIQQNVERFVLCKIKFLFTIKLELNLKFSS